MTRSEKDLRDALIREALPRLSRRIVSIALGPRWPRTKMQLIRAEFHDTVVDIVWLMTLTHRTLVAARPRPSGA